jgi:hypothetical protein
MSEVEALLGLYGAIDRAVVARKVRAARLAPLLRAYRGGAATGWYDGQYRRWAEGVNERAKLRAREVRSEPKVRPEREAPMAFTDDAAYAEEAPGTPAEAVTLSPEAQEVHDALAAFAPIPLEGRAAARRLLAVTVAARAFPRHFAPDGTHAAVAKAALTFEDSGADREDVIVRRADNLHVRFAQDFRTMGDWGEVVRAAVNDGVLPRSFLSQEDAPPCTGRLIMRPDPDGSDPDPCTVLEAGFTTKDITFAQAKQFLEPSNWVYPGSFWCEMTRDPKQLPSGSWVYHETVATSCPPTTALWSVSTDLQFWFSHPTPNEARIEYDLAPGLPTSLSDIEIDEGSLRVIELPTKDVQVVTTKRVRFTDAFDGAGLSMFLCATGYSSILEDVVFTIAKAPSAKSQPFPVAAPQGGPMTPPPNPTVPDTLESLATEAAEFAAKCVKDCADIGKASLESMQKGTYKVENAWADGIKLWTMSIGSMAKALDVSTRAAKVVAQSSSDGT